MIAKIGLSGLISVVWAEILHEGVEALESGRYLWSGPTSDQSPSIIYALLGIVEPGSIGGAVVGGVGNCLGQEFIGGIGLPI